jgi:hypothetical protein
MDQFAAKLSGECYAVRSMSQISSTDTLKSVYFAGFRFVMKHGKIFCGNLSNSRKIFTLEKKIIRIMDSVKPRYSFRSLFKRLDTLTLPCEYIFSLKNFIVNNQEYFQADTALHSVNARNSCGLDKAIAKLSCFQKSAYYSGINIFNNLPCSL